jgi:hypothetical protein
MAPGDFFELIKIKRQSVHLFQIVHQQTRQQATATQSDTSFARFPGCSKLGKVNLITSRCGGSQKKGPV